MRLRRSALARKGEARAGDTRARYVKLREVRKSSRTTVVRSDKKKWEDAESCRERKVERECLSIM